MLYKTDGDLYTGFTSRIGPRTVVFEDNNLGSRKLKHSEVLLIDLAPIGKAPETPSDVFLEVHGQHGSVFTGTPASAPEGKLVLDSFFSDLRWSLTLRNIRTILIKNGKTTYLSDLDPINVVQKQVFPWQPDPAEAPSLPPRYQWRKDQAVPDQPDKSEPITLNDQKYPKGIGCTPYTKLTYALNENFTSFQSRIGIDDAVKESPHQGSVVFRVYVDGEKRFDSGAKKPSWFPRKIKVDVSGAKRMSLEVDLGTGYLDFANWAGARLIRGDD